MDEGQSVSGPRSLVAARLPARSRAAAAAEREPRRVLCVSLHDVAPATWPACERVLAALTAASAPLRVALLVVPRYRGVDSALDRIFLRAIETRAALGDELVLHGYTHVDEAPQRGWARPLDVLRRRVYTAGEGEFSSLEADEALRRVHAGLDWFRARGWSTSGFVAPAWLLSRAARRALDETGLAYSCTRAELLLLQQRRSLVAPSLVYSTRSPWRRAVSVQFNRALLAANHDRRILRLALHPHDADHAKVRRSWQCLLRRALASRMACTEGQVVAALNPLALRAAADDAMGPLLDALPEHAAPGVAARGS